MARNTARSGTPWRSDVSTSPATTATKTNEMTMAAPPRYGTGARWDLPAAGVSKQFQRFATRRATGVHTSVTRAATANINMHDHQCRSVMNPSPA